MNKYKETFGVDISKDVFDLHGSTSGHDQFKNNEKGFAAFLKILPEGSIVVMEARATIITDSHSFFTKTTSLYRL